MSEEEFLVMDDRSWEKGYDHDLPEVPLELKRSIERALGEHLEKVDTPKAAAVA